VCKKSTQHCAMIFNTNCANMTGLFFSIYVPCCQLGYGVFNFRDQN
jgi:hypothetical protein